jgi:glycosyltransferase involved in cell wall biosynthesis
MDITKVVISDPLVSIVIPVYNGSNFLSEAIDSALNQTYKNIEVIVVNDGSNDEFKTQKIALSYGNKIRYFEKENGGVSTALNLGIREMKGEYFSWLSHDDKYLPDKVKIQVDYLLSNHEFKACYSNYLVINDKNLVTDHVDVPYYERVEAIKTLIGSGYINGCTMLISKDCFDQVGVFNPGLLYSQDIEMWIRILNICNITKIDQYLVQERHHENQDSITKNKAMNDEILKMYVDVFESLSLFRLLSTKNSEKHGFKRDKANGYLWLADKIVYSRRGYSIANNLYKNSLKHWNSIQNPAWMRNLIRSKNLFFLHRIKNKLTFSHKKN